jgi:voltage-gated potassium channel Kch
MVNEMNVDRLRDHFIICGYGRVARTVVDQLERLEIPFVLIETNEGLFRESLLTTERRSFEVMRSVMTFLWRRDWSVPAAFASWSTATPTISTSPSPLAQPEGQNHHARGQQRYATAMRNSGPDEAIIPEYEGGLMTGWMIQKYYPAQMAIE